MIQRLLKNLDVMLDSNMCVVKWSNNKLTSKNIGDALNEYLFSKVFGKEIVNSRDVVNIGINPVYSFIGSVLDNSNIRNLTILGSGFKRENSKVQVIPKSVQSCRGPLTRKKLMDLGLEVPEIYGDPAILLPKYYNIPVVKKYRMGLIPHYIDQDVEILKKFNDRNDVKIIDVFSPMEEFVKDIKSCEFTMSSSLHGIILSHAYGIPSGWIKLSDKLVGGSFKFDDYYQSLGEERAHPINIDSESTIRSLASQATLISTNDLADRLLSHFESFKIN